MARRLPIFACGTLAVLLAIPLLGSDEWLVYVGGGLEAVEGGWSERHGQVIFTQLGGTLVSVPHDEVDLATSAMITWQLGGRRKPPPQADVDDAPVQEPGSSQPCTPARLLGLSGSETMEIRTGELRETVHLACLDAPETHHRYPQLGWFGRATISAIELDVKPGDEICVSEHDPPLRDGEDHRIVHVALASGRDYTAKVIASGLGLLRTGTCANSAYYRDLENQAISEQRGLWGSMSERASIAAANLAVVVGGSPSAMRAPSRRSGGG